MLPDGLNWLRYFAGSSKSHHSNSIYFIFLGSPHQVDIKILSNPPDTFWVFQYSRNSVICIAISKKVPSNSNSDKFMKVCNECSVNSVMELSMMGQIQLDFGTKINIIYFKMFQKTIFISNGKKVRKNQIILDIENFGSF